ncbi:DUF4363 family protein [Clostridium sp. P21]|uniref:DUF4363 family protein n=1 Tax=Clostridium muellerianum TaxID=2716538 RepID=A0A7Y0EDH5_9CLOT|nr:DUF4363 family protein [Clostridium muellerianum]NMM61504.1 DUF4363 family protein [Clostridium muellerianum]
MRNLLAAFIIFTSMLLSLIFSINYLGRACTKLDTLNAQIERSIDTQSWDEAYNKSLILLDNWDNCTRKISIFVNHAEIDNINNEIWKLTQYTKCHNEDESLASNHVIKFLLKHIINMEKVNIQNVF